MCCQQKKNRRYRKSCLDNKNSGTVLDKENSVPYVEILAVEAKVYDAVRIDVWYNIWGMNLRREICSVWETGGYDGKETYDNAD